MGNGSLLDGCDLALRTNCSPGVTGVTVAAIAAWLLMLSLFTGVIVWWPVNGQWRLAFVI
ncbi:MAG: PepSY domain-containing protein [Nitrospira sp.]|nr:PepSY domain-containing protein [Nitrospira sp.]